MINHNPTELNCQQINACSKFTMKTLDSCTDSLLESKFAFNLKIADSQN